VWYNAGTLCGQQVRYTLLSKQKVHEVLTLLGQGLSRHKVAKATGVSIRSIHRIERGVHKPKRREPVRCPDCGNLISSFPCLMCIARQERSASSPPEAEHLFIPMGLELKGKTKERYEAVRRKVEAEIAAGKRTMLQFAAPYNLCPKKRKNY